MIKRRIVLICLLFVLLSLFVISCDNTSINSNKGQVEVTQDPVIEDVEEVEGIRVITTTNVSYYMYSMIPLWTESDIQGSTKKNTSIVNNQTYDGYKIISASTSLGYFEQGKWHLALYILDENQNLIINTPVVDADYYLNTVSGPISFNIGSVLFDPDKTSILKINNVKFELVEDPSKYGKEEGKDYYLDVRLKSLKDNSIKSYSVDISKITFINNDEGKAVVGVINDFVLNDAVPYGSYALSIVLVERKGSSFIDAGGTTFSFFVSGDNCEIVSSSDNAIHIYPSDYVTPGTGGGIEIDSGTNSTVEVKGYKFVNGVKTELSTTVTANTSDTVRFEPVVTKGPASITSYKWFIDGEEQKGTNGCLTYKPTTAKTYTITYMFLDGTSYNTISGNYYLTVTSGSNH